MLVGAKIINKSEETVWFKLWKVKNQTKFLKSNKSIKNIFFWRTLILLIFMETGSKKVKDACFMSKTHLKAIHNF